MKKAKIKKTQNTKAIKQTNSDYSIKNMLLIILIILLVFVIFYIITTFVVKKETKVNYNTDAVIDSSVITLGNLTNRTEDEYYVLAYRKSNDNSSIKVNYKELYDNYIAKYKEKENSLKFYYVNLNDILNKSYISDDLNITDDLSNLKINDEVLFKIKDKKIEKYYVGNSKIIDKLSRL